MAKAAKQYCYLCGRRPIGAGEAFIEGHWYGFCDACFKAYSRGAVTTVEELTRPNGRLVRTIERNKKTAPERDEQTLRLWE
jgi:hypothetical protein